MLKSGMRILGTGRALPCKCISNEDLSRLVDTNDEWIRTRTGIQYRYRCSCPEESCTTLAIQAARQAIEDAGIAKDELGAVIVATSTPEYVFPSTACLVQRALELPEEIIAFDLNAACTGFLSGMGVVRGLLQNMEKPCALLIGSEQMTKLIDYGDRSTCILFGDGAGAVVFAHSEGLFVQKSWSRGDVEVLNCPGIGSEKSYLTMMGNEVFRFAVTALQQALEETLDQAGVTMDDVDYVICHQANERIIRHVQKRYRQHMGKFIINIQNYGNTSAASIPIALDELWKEKKLRQGMTILCVGFGAGLTYSGAIMEI